MLDLVIRNGSVIDGTGARPPFEADVGVKDGIIVSVGKVTDAAKEVIEAGGRSVIPGLVDIHTHYDGQVSWDNVMAPSSINGVTTIAMGNCGVGFAPASPDKREWLIHLLEGVEDIPGTALTEGLRWDWESFPEYLDAVDRRSYAVDVGAHIPHAALRTYVMGTRGANHHEDPTPSELERIEQLTFEGLQAGAIGFSSSRSAAHLSLEGDNIGTLSAEEAELMAVARALRRNGSGVLQLISDAYVTMDDRFADSEWNLIRNLAIEGQCPVSLSLMQAPTAPDRWRYMLDKVNALSDAGLHVRAQVAPRPIGMIIGLRSTANPFKATPTFQELVNLPFEERLAALSTPEIKARVLAETASLSLSGYTTDALAQNYKHMYRMTDPVDYEPTADQSLAAEAHRLGKDPIDHTYDVLLEEQGRRLLYSPILNFQAGNLNVVHEMLSARNTLFGLSDGGAHCGTICDATFPTTTLALWSKGNRDGRRIPMEKLVHGYSQRNAAHVGWFDRGVIAPGYLADLNVINMDELSLSPPEVVQDLPAGGTRLLQTAKGYDYTIKSGMVTFENGKWSGRTPGGLLRGRQLARTA